MGGQGTERSEKKIVWRSRLLLFALAVGVGSLALAWQAAAQEPVTSRLKLSIGGYIKADFLYRTNNGGVGFAGAVPGLVNTGFAIVPQKNTIAGANGQFIAAASETRFNFTLNAPDWRGFKAMGLLEMDFLGDTASTVERFCPAGTLCVTAQQSGNPAGSINNGTLRIRHAFFQLSGEGLGGQWNVLFGQTWNLFGLAPYYAGSTVSFAGSDLFSDQLRFTQLRLTHAWQVFRDFTWETAIAARSDTTNLNEVPGLDGSLRWTYAGWQGFQAGFRRALSFGISGTVQRQKADVYALAAGSGLANTASQANGTRSLSATAWGVNGGLFLPLLPGRSATDRTWALSVVSEGGYGEGVNTLIPGTNPYPGAITAGANNRADPGAVFFKPGSCTLLNNPPLTAGGVGSVAVQGAAAAACATATPLPAGAVLAPTELSLTKTPWASYSGQFYLPYGFWISGGQKYIWYPNADNAVAQICLNVPITLGAACGTAGNPLITPVNQGRFNSANGTLLNNTSSLFTGRDSLLKRQTYSFVALFYDMTPNIRLGFEWGMHGTNRKDSEQDNQSHRWQFGGYFFF